MNPIFATTFIVALLAFYPGAGAADEVVLFNIDEHTSVTVLPPVLNKAKNTESGARLLIQQKNAADRYLELPGHVDNPLVLKNITDVRRRNDNSIWILSRSHAMQGLMEVNVDSGTVMAEHTGRNFSLSPNGESFAWTGYGNPLAVMANGAVINYYGRESRETVSEVYPRLGDSHFGGSVFVYSLVSPVTTCSKLLKPFVWVDDHSFAFVYGEQEVREVNCFEMSEDDLNPFTVTVTVLDSVGGKLNYRVTVEPGHGPYERLLIAGAREFELNMSAKRVDNIRIPESIPLIKALRVVDQGSSQTVPRGLNMH